MGNNDDWFDSMKKIIRVQGGQADAEWIYDANLAEYDPAMDSNIAIYIDAMKDHMWDVKDHMWDVMADGTEVRSTKTRHNHSSIAEKVMRELEENGIASKILLTDDEVAKWWAEVKAADAKKEAERIAKEEAKRKKAADAELRRNTLASLTPEQKRVLGIKEK